MNKFKSLIAVASIAIVAGVLTGCSVSKEKTWNDADYYNALTYYANDEISDYVDPETGVHYLLYDGYEGCGITVRYNADGTIMVDSHPEDR